MAHFIIDFEGRLAHNALVRQDACRPHVHLLIIGADRGRLQMSPGQLWTLLQVCIVIAQHLRGSL